MRKPHLLGACTLALAMMLPTGCKKYEDGPLMSLRSKKGRIANTWLAESVLKNGVDSTMYFAAAGSELVMEKDGSVTATIYRTNGVQSDTTNSEGRWELHEKNEVFALILTDLKTSEVDTNWWYITRLKEKEFWLRDDDKDGDGNYDEEIRLTSKE